MKFAATQNANKTRNKTVPGKSRSEEKFKEVISVLISLPSEENILCTYNDMMHGKKKRKIN